MRASVIDHDLLDLLQWIADAMNAIWSADRENLGRFPISADRTVRHVGRKSEHQVGVFPQTTRNYSLSCWADEHRFPVFPEDPMYAAKTVTGIFCPSRSRWGNTFPSSSRSTRCNGRRSSGSWLET